MGRMQRKLFPLPVEKMEKLQHDMDNSPIEEVRLTVPTTDDKTLPVLTFRTWVLGLSSCIIFAFIKQFFFYRQNQIYIPNICAQLLVLPIGRFMAATLPTKQIKIQGTKWTVSMNPGPFNVKEHIMITLFAYSAVYTPHSQELISQMKVFYHRKVHPLAALLLMVTTQLMGFGFAGFFMKFLVESPSMWWPEVLIDVSTFRALHETEVRSKGQLKRLQFLLIVLISSFAYYIVPSYFFPSISALSFVCWIWKSSVTAQQIGSGYYGLGLGSFGLDWPTISSIGSPLASPAFAIFNVMAGFIIFLYIVIPIAYWTNTYNAKRFSIFSWKLFDVNGNTYNISRVLDERNFKFDQEAYDKYSPMHMSIIMLYVYGFGFATISASIAHVVLYHGRSIWSQYRDGGQSSDIHTRLMQNYKSVPQWWFCAILISTITVAIFTVEGFKGQIQLPFWGVLLACAMVLVLLLPVCVIQATTSKVLTLNHISELTIGYLYPGKPAAIIAFKSYAMDSMIHAIGFLYDFKLGLYMKIPPRSMFIAQIVSTIVSCFAEFTMIWWLFSTVENICDPTKLPAGSPWTCPGENLIFNYTAVWGLIGPSRIFAPLGTYTSINFFFLIGILATLLIWMLSCFFPEKKWIRFINVPVILAATSAMPYERAVNYWSWLGVGFIFNFLVYRKYKGWWAKYNYLLSSGLDAGTAFMALLVCVLQFQGIYGIKWWGEALDDHCPLARCPTAPGIKVDGCPVFS